MPRFSGELTAHVNYGPYKRPEKAEWAWSESDKVAHWYDVEDSLGYVQRMCDHTPSAGAVVTASYGEPFCKKCQRKLDG